MKQRNQRRDRGAVLVMFSLMIFLIFGFVGMAFDLGRVYMARNEAQSFADAAALAGAVMLDGTTTTKAYDAVDGIYMTTAAKWKKYHFHTEDFAGYTIRFSTDGFTYVSLAKGAAAPGYRFVEVLATTDIPMYLSPVLTGDTMAHPAARAVGAQIKKTIWEEGLIPFAPKAHCTNDAFGISLGFTPCGTPPSTLPDEGLVKCPAGTLAANCPTDTYYTLRWGASWSKVFDDKDPQRTNWCGGDQPGATTPFAGPFEQLYASPSWTDATGFFTTGTVNSASDFNDLVSNSWVGGPVDLSVTNGFDGANPQQVQAVSKALEDRAALGPPQSYVSMPVIDPVTGAIISVRTFELYQPVSQKGGNGFWCAIYRGVSLYGTGTEQVLQDGIYEVRLVR